MPVVVGALVIPGEDVPVVVVTLPNTPPPAAVAVPVPSVMVPVQVAPIGQQAMLLALSFVQTEPEVQQAPP